MDLIQEAERQAEFIDPKTLTADDNKAICAALEALFDVEKDPKTEYPFELSELIRGVVGDNRTITAINAGDGSIIAAFDTAWCFGLEQDEKRARKRRGSYQWVQGELLKVAGLFEPLQYKMDDTVVVLREDANVAETLAAATLLHDRDDNYLIVVDHGDNEQAIRALGGFYLKLTVNTDGGEFRVYFGATPQRISDVELQTRAATLDSLDLLVPWVKEQKSARLNYEHRYGNSTRARDAVDVFKAVHREYGRRFLRESVSYDLELVGGKVLNFSPSPWAHRALEQMGRGDLQNRLHRREIIFFAKNVGFWEELLVLEDKDVLLISPDVKMRVAPIVHRALQSNIPLRPLTPQERIAYLEQKSEIKCIEDDPDRGLKAGTYYRLYVREETFDKLFDKKEKVTRNKVTSLEKVRKKRQYRHGRVVIDNRHSFYNDDPHHIRYLLKHFEVPDPGDIATRYPEVYKRTLNAVKAVEKKYLEPRGFQLKRYQRDDIARKTTKGRGLLAWEQGLGKTIGGIAFALTMDELNGYAGPKLIVVPQDLIAQWKDEAKKFYGVEMTHLGRHKGGQTDREDGPTGGAVKNIIEAKQLADALKANPKQEGWYITHFEALTSGGARNLYKVEEPFTVRIEKEWKTIPSHTITDPDTGERRFIPTQRQEVEKEISSAYECPGCGGSMMGKVTCPNFLSRQRVNFETPDGRTITRFKGVLTNGDGKLKRCGYSRYVYLIPSIGSLLSTAFKAGTIIVDEGTQIASAKNSTEKTSSEKTKAVTGLRAKNRVVMSGTPVKNFIAQAFWLLWWSIGDGTDRFPYHYDGGRAKFAEDFSVWEWSLNDETGNWSGKKTVGEVTNHAKLWAQLSSVMIRRTKEQTGELIPQKKVHVVHAPLGVAQREQMEFWIENFPHFYAERHPEDLKVKRGTHEQMAAMLGLDVKLNYASVLPKCDRDWEWTGVEVSNYTPAALKTLETVMGLVKQGRRVLVGTDGRPASGWLAAELASKGLRVKSMLNSQGETVTPPERSKITALFQSGEIDVLVSTEKAIRLGHNLDQGTAVVFFGLDWDYETYAQFRDRVHRLTSIGPVDVYVVITGEPNLTLLGRKWDVIKDKEKGARQAIDGELSETIDEPVNEASIVAELAEKGIPATGNEVDEADIEEAWATTPSIDAFEIPDGFTKDQAVEWIIDWDAANDALALYLAEQEQIETDRVATEVAAAWDVAHLEYEQRDLAWETVLDWAFAADATFEENRTIEVEEQEPEAVVVTDAPAPAQPVSSPAPTASLTADLIGQLKELKELHDIGVLDADEFKAAKGAIIEQMKAPVAAPVNQRVAAEVPQLSLAI